MTTAVMTGDVDVILHGATLAALCEDLQPYIDATEGFMDQIYLVASRYASDAPAQPKVTGVSYTLTPMIVYLDSQIFADYGVELPDSSWTWEDLLALAEQLTGIDPVTGEQTYGYKFTSRTASNNFYFNHMMLSQAYGGNIIHYADKLSDITADYKCEASMKAFEMIEKLSAFVSPDCKEGVVDDVVLTADNNVAIRIEQNPFTHCAEAEAAGNADRWVWQTLPCATEGEGAGKPTYFLGESNMAIAYNSDAKDFAWEFIRFMTGDPEVQDWIARTRNMPNNRNGNELVARSLGAERTQAAYDAVSNLPYGMFEGPFLTNEHFAPLNKEIRMLAQKYAVTDTAIAVAWLLRHPAGIQVITGTTNKDRLTGLCAAARVRLTRPEWYRLYRLAGNPLP